MFKTFKRIILMVPIFAFGILVSSGNQLEAAATIYEPTSVIQDIYFTNDNKITISSPQQFLTETFVEYRIISPVSHVVPGQRTSSDWIREYHADSDWTDYEFDIDFRNIDYTLPYSDEVPQSIASEEATYYIQLKYYESLFKGFLPKHKSQYDKTLTVVRWNQDPSITTNRTDNDYDLVVSTKSVITSVKYMYTIGEIATNRDAMLDAYEGSANRADLTSEIVNGQLETTITNVLIGDDNYGYLYIIAEDANGLFSYKAIDLATGTDTGDGIDPETGGETPEQEIDPGEWILISLIAVLFITTGLIVTQKIVSRRKITI